MPKVIEPKTTYIDDRQVPLDELQKMVGGLIQLVNVQTDDGETHIIMDEEGKNKNKPINFEATDIWFPGESVLKVPDYIVGDAGVLTDKALLE